MSNMINWYFDFISPFAYLQQIRLREFPNDIAIQSRPVLFAALLNHWQHKGPAEIPAKRPIYLSTCCLAGKATGRSIAYAASASF